MKLMITRVCPATNLATPARVPIAHSAYPAQRVITGTKDAAFTSAPHITTPTAGIASALSVPRAVPSAIKRRAFPAWMIGTSTARDGVCHTAAIIATQINTPTASCANSVIRHAAPATARRSTPAFHALIRSSCRIRAASPNATKDDFRTKATKCAIRAFTRAVNVRPSPTARNV